MLDVQLTLFSADKFTSYFESRCFLNSGLGALLKSSFNPLVPIFFGLENSRNFDSVAKWRGSSNYVFWLSYLRTNGMAVNTGVKNDVLLPLAEFSSWSADSLYTLVLPESMTFVFRNSYSRYALLPFSSKNVGVVGRDFLVAGVVDANSKFSNLLLVKKNLVRMGRIFYRFSFKSFYLNFASLFSGFFSGELVLRSIDNFWGFANETNFFGIVNWLSSFSGLRAYGIKLLFLKKWAISYNLRFTVYDRRNYFSFWSVDLLFISKYFVNLYFIESLRVNLKNLLFKSFGEVNLGRFFNVVSNRKTYIKILGLKGFLLFFNALCFALVCFRNSFKSLDFVVSYLLKWVVFYLVELVFFKFSALSNYALKLKIFYVGLLSCLVKRLVSNILKFLFLRKREEDLMISTDWSEEFSDRYYFFYMRDNLHPHLIEKNKHGELGEFFVTPFDIYRWLYPHARRTYVTLVSAGRNIDYRFRRAGRLWVGLGSRFYVISGVFRFLIKIFGIKTALAVRKNGGYRLLINPVRLILLSDINLVKYYFCFWTDWLYLESTSMLLYGIQDYATLWYNFYLRGILFTNASYRNISFFASSGTFLFFREMFFGKLMRILKFLFIPIIANFKSFLTDSSFLRSKFCVLGFDAFRNLDCFSKKGVFRGGYTSLTNKQLLSEFCRRGRRFNKYERDFFPRQKQKWWFKDGVRVPFRFSFKDKLLRLNPNLATYKWYTGWLHFFRKNRSMYRTYKFRTRFWHARRLFRGFVGYKLKGGVGQRLFGYWSLNFLNFYFFNGRRLTFRLFSVNFLPILLSFYRLFKFLNFFNFLLFDVDRKAYFASFLYKKTFLRGYFLKVFRWFWRISVSFKAFAGLMGKFFWRKFFLDSFTNSFELIRMIHSSGFLYSFTNYWSNVNATNYSENFNLILRGGKHRNFFRNFSLLQDSIRARDYYFKRYFEVFSYTVNGLSGVNPQKLLFLEYNRSFFSVNRTNVFALGSETNSVCQPFMWLFLSLGTLCRELNNFSAGYSINSWASRKLAYLRFLIYLRSLYFRFFLVRRGSELRVDTRSYFSNLLEKMYPVFFDKEFLVVDRSLKDLTLADFNGSRKDFKVNLVQPATKLHTLYVLWVSLMAFSGKGAGFLGLDKLIEYFSTRSNTNVGFNWVKIVCECWSLIRFFRSGSAASFTVNFMRNYLGIFGSKWFKLKNGFVFNLIRFFHKLLSQIRNRKMKSSYMLKSSKGRRYVWLDFCLFKGYFLRKLLRKDFNKVGDLVKLINKYKGFVSILDSPTLLHVGKLERLGCFRGIYPYTNLQGMLSFYSKRFLSATLLKSKVLQFLTVEKYSLLNINKITSLALISEKAVRVFNGFSGIVTRNCIIFKASVFTRLRLFVPAATFRWFFDSRVFNIKWDYSFILFSKTLIVEFLVNFFFSILSVFWQFTRLNNRKLAFSRCGITTFNFANKALFACSVNGFFSAESQLSSLIREQGLISFDSFSVFRRLRELVFTKMAGFVVKGVDSYNFSGLNFYSFLVNSLLLRPAGFCVESFSAIFAVCCNLFFYVSEKLSSQFFWVFKTNFEFFTDSYLDCLSGVSTRFLSVEFIKSFLFSSYLKGFLINKFALFGFSVTRVLGINSFFSVLLEVSLLAFFNGIKNPLVYKKLNFFNAFYFNVFLLFILKYLVGFSIFSFVNFLHYKYFVLIKANGRIVLRSNLIYWNSLINWFFDLTSFNLMGLYNRGFLSVGSSLGVQALMFFRFFLFRLFSRTSLNVIVTGSVSNSVKGLFAFDQRNDFIGMFSGYLTENWVSSFVGGNPSKGGWLVPSKFIKINRVFSRAIGFNDCGKKGLRLFNIVSYICLLKLLLVVMLNFSLSRFSHFRRRIFTLGSINFVVGKSFGLSTEFLKILKVLVDSTFVGCLRRFFYLGVLLSNNNGRSFVLVRRSVKKLLVVKDVSITNISFNYAKVRFFKLFLFVFTRFLLLRRGLFNANFVFSCEAPIFKLWNAKDLEYPEQTKWSVTWRKYRSLLPDMWKESYFGQHIRISGMFPYVGAQKIKFFVPVKYRLPIRYTAKHLYLNWRKQSHKDDKVENFGWEVQKILLRTTNVTYFDQILLQFHQQRIKEAKHISTAVKDHKGLDKDKKKYFWWFLFRERPDVRKKKLPFFNEFNPGLVSKFYQGLRLLIRKFNLSGLGGKFVAKKKLFRLFYVLRLFYFYFLQLTSTKASVWIWMKFFTNSVFSTIYDLRGVGRMMADTFSLRTSSINSAFRLRRYGYYSGLSYLWLLTKYRRELATHYFVTKRFGIGSVDIGRFLKTQPILYKSYGFFSNLAINKYFKGRRTNNWRVRVRRFKKPYLFLKRKNFHIPCQNKRTVHNELSSFIGKRVVPLNSLNVKQNFLDKLLININAEHFVRNTSDVDEIRASSLPVVWNLIEQTSEHVSARTLNTMDNVNRYTCRKTNPHPYFHFVYEDLNFLFYKFGLFFCKRLFLFFLTKNIFLRLFDRLVSFRSRVNIKLFRVKKLCFIYKFLVLVFVSCSKFLLRYLVINKRVSSGFFFRIFLSELFLGYCFAGRHLLNLSFFSAFSLQFFVFFPLFGVVENAGGFMRNDNFLGAPNAFNFIMYRLNRFVGFGGNFFYTFLNYNRFSEASIALSFSSNSCFRALNYKLSVFVKKKWFRYVEFKVLKYKKIMKKSFGMRKHWVRGTQCFKL